MNCVFCGDKPTNQRWLLIPGTIIVPNTYFVGESHKEKDLFFQDVYNEDGSRKVLRQSQADSDAGTE
jgi:hypothetical protein